jgi:hypothetical protein
VSSQRIFELLIGFWNWLPVRGRVGVTILAAAQLYWVWWFFAYYIRAPIALYRRSVMGRDTTRTLDPLYSEPIDPELLHYLETTERKLAALGFRDAHRTTNRTTYPLTLVESSLERPDHGDHVVVIALRPTGEHVSHEPENSMSFDSEFVDGVRLVTSNVRDPRHWPDAREVDHVRFADVADPAELYHLHRRRVDARRARAAQKKISRGKTPEQRLVFVKRRNLDLYKHLVRCRYRRRTAAGLRPTLRGAAFGAWRHVFPWRTIDQWWQRRRARTVRRLA